jgi:hypothetical protein
MCDSKQSNKELNKAIDAPDKESDLINSVARYFYSQRCYYVDGIRVMLQCWAQIKTKGQS